MNMVNVMIEYCNEILNEIEKGFPISPNAFKIGEAAITGMLYEVGASPTPGLVSPYSQGTHNDMDFFTFLRSTTSIAAAMYICAQIGIFYDSDLLKKIRSVGIAAEKNMLGSTKGVNTQRGLLFVAGITAASAGNCISMGINVDRFNISRECSCITAGIVKRELETLEYKDELSNGEKLFLKHGIKGVRGEVENGLPTVLNYGLPLYETAINAGLTINNALVHSLIGIMSVVEDTVVINRKGLEGLEFMRVESKKAMDLGGMYTVQGENYIKKVEEKFVVKGISPGGAADLLAITVMLYELEKIYNKKL